MKRVLLALVLSGVAFATPVFASTPLPEPVGYVNDFAAVLSPSAAEALETKLRDFNASTTNQVALVTVTSLGGDYIEHYAEQLFQIWGIGTKEKNNGVLLIVATGDRQFRIEVGYGLEGALTDGEAKQIMDGMTPMLKDGDYDAALAFGVDGIIAATEGEYAAPSSSSSLDLESIFPIFFFIVLVLQWLVAILSRSKSVWAGGVVGAVAGAALSSIFGWWILAGVLTTLGMVVLGVLFDYAVSSAYHAAKSSGGTPPWWTGGSGNFGSGSSGGFGGFGGGSSGGGGASGSY